jgi:GT2 family glycosyltransferase
MVSLADLVLPLSSHGNDARPRLSGRVSVQGKFLTLGDKKFLVRGVTYGAFRPDRQGREYHELGRIDEDFANMAALGINTVRIPHTMPPCSLLDIAQKYGLCVMVGLSAEQSVGYLIDGQLPPDFEDRFRTAVRSCTGHPALLCYSLGNEIAAPQVRWLGDRRVSAYLRWLNEIVKQEDPEAIVTYVNYPSTEYLDLPFLDIVSFNVYLESQNTLQRYLPRLQNIAASRPLLLTELGIDSLRHGELMQAEVIDWQVRTSFAAGAAGVIVFSWTDEWYRAGEPVLDWAFGVTDNSRKIKPAGFALAKAFRETPFPLSARWPRISVIVCTYNGARTIGKCLEGLSALDYPDYEVIVVNDGSQDETAQIAKQFRVSLINQVNSGLSYARNVGLAASTGCIIAYIDDDAYPDPDWLRYVAAAFAASDHVGIGGPNIPPPSDGIISECIDAAPGGPAHVLISDEIAEHIPGCNMAFRKEALLAVDGFDPQFRVAGDDVDLCWRLQDKGWTIGYCPTALVWHYRRDTIRAYWKQQSGYGKAEALLERKWPSRYNALGHINWAGQIYGAGLLPGLLARRRIYHGVWGTAPFQRVESFEANFALILLGLPEAYLAFAGLAILGIVGLVWTPSLAAFPILSLLMLIRIVDVGLTVVRVPVVQRQERLDRRTASLVLLVFLCLLQPLARMIGRFRHGLAPWRWRAAAGPILPRWRSSAIWSKQSRDPATWVHVVQECIRRTGAPVFSGGPYDRWDLEVPGGLLGRARLLMAVEDHGAGSQYLRIAMWPWPSTIGIAIVVSLLALALAGEVTAAPLFSGMTIAIAGLVVVRGIYESARALGAMQQASSGLPNA